MIIYFHNLKFDGSFIIDYFLKQKGYREGSYLENGRVKFKDEYRLRHHEYTYLISEKGVWYQITISHRGKIIKFYDSYKIIPFGLRIIGKSFETVHQKLEMEYTGERYANGDVTKDEMEYFKNDILTLKEALEIMFKRGLDKMTIGANCFSAFKRTYDSMTFKQFFPNIYEIRSNGCPLENAGEYVHKSYFGAWTYVNPKYKDIIVYDGITVDANSLYPSQMHSLSNNYYPVGKPRFWAGDIPDFLDMDDFSDYFFFVRFSCRFKVKDGFLPFIQIKNDLRFNGREMLTSTELKNGLDLPVIMTRTCVDFKLILEHYDLYDLRILDGCYFKTAIGLFDEYIDEYMQQKIDSTTKVDRTIAKLMLNNLYGKMATYTDSSFKTCYLKDYVVHFENHEEYEKDPSYIPVGSAITSYSRNCTIRLAQKNIEHFCYADTDSLHCTCCEKDLIDVPIDDKALCFWKVEAHWKRGWFHRAKSYIETYIRNDGIEDYNITCAGMGTKCKEIFRLALLNRDGNMPEIDRDVYVESQIKMIEKGADITDFKRGLEIFGNLKAKRIIGGIILQDTTFFMRK